MFFNNQKKWQRRNKSVHPVFIISCSQRSERFHKFQKLNLKTLFFFITTIAFSLTTKAQLDKGIWLLGGSGSFNSYKEDYRTPTYNQTAKITSIDLGVSVGYFLVDKFAAGLRPYLSTYNSKVTNASVGGGAPTYKFQTAVGPFARYYFLNKDKPFNILADISYQFGINKFTVTPIQKGKFNSVSFMGGTAIFFNSTASIEILLGYKQQIESLVGNYNRDKKGLHASIGFTFHLEKL